MGVAGRPPAKSPSSVTSFEFEVLRGTANPIVKKLGGRKRRYVEERGTIVSARAESKEIPEAALSGMNEALSKLNGLSTRQLIGEDGEIAEVTTEALAGKKLPAEVKAVLDQSFDAQRRFPFRLPPKAVGVGGKWRFRESVELSGVTMWQIAEMSVTRIAGDRVTISLRCAMRRPAKRCPTPAAGTSRGCGSVPRRRHGGHHDRPDDSNRDCRSPLHDRESEAVLVRG